MRSNSSLTGCARPRKGVFPARPHRTFARPPAAGVVSRRSWLRTLYGACSRHRNWRRPRRCGARRQRHSSLDARCFGLLLCAARSRSQARRRFSPSARNTRSGGCRRVRTADPGLFISIGRHSSGRFANISAHDHETSEVWLIDLASPDAEPMLVAPCEAGVQYEVEHHPAFRGGSALIIRTNADGAEDFKISWTPLATPSRACWRDLVAHRPGVYVVSFMLLMDWLVRLEREDSLPRIVVRHLTSEEEHVIAFAEEAYSLGVDGGYEFATNLLRFNYSSMTTPTEVWDYDLASRERTLRKRCFGPIPGPLPPSSSRRVK